MTDPSAAFPTFGTRKTSWDDIRKTLKRFGAKEMRTTGGHNNVMMELPTGTTVMTGKPNGRHKRSHPVMKEGLRSVLSAVAEAGLDPQLFLAALDNDGGITWYQRPEEVEAMARFLRDERPPLDTPTDWKRALQAYADSLPVPTPPEEPKLQVDLTEEEPVQTATPAPPEPIYSTMDVMDLAGVPRGSALRNRVVAAVGKGMTTRRGFFADLKERGDAVRKKQHEQAGYSENRFTEAGALAVAQWVQETRGEELAKLALAPPPSPTSSASPPETDAPVEPPPPAPATSSITMAAPYTPRDHYMSVGTAVLRVCQAAGIEPRFIGTRLDLEDTFLALAEALA